MIGLVTDLVVVLRERQGEVDQLRRNSVEAEASLGVLLDQSREAREALAKMEGEREATAHQISELNAALASLHQRSAVLTRRADELKEKMVILGRSDPGYRHGRRERAKLLTSLEDLGGEIEGIEARLEKARAGLGELESGLGPARDQLTECEDEMTRLQAEIPQPGLLVEVFEFRTAILNCDLFLDGEVEPFGAGVLLGLESMISLHRELREGRYRIDRNSEFIGGRATATGEAMYAAVAIGRQDKAGELFGLACEPDLFFHQIFDVFRCWTLGLYLEGRFDELKALLKTHQFSEGVREAYVESFSALLAGDSIGLSHGLKELVSREWDQWLGAGPRRGMGVVNFAATALVVLASKAGMTVPMSAPTIPAGVVKSAS